MLRAAGLGSLLVIRRRDRMLLRVGRGVLLRVRLRVVLLMHDARGSGVLLLRLALKVLIRRGTLLLVVGMMLHREHAH